MENFAPSLSVGVRTTVRRRNLGVKLMFKATHGERRWMEGRTAAVIKLV